MSDDNAQKMAFSLFAGASGMVDEPGMIDRAAALIRRLEKERDEARAATIPPGHVVVPEEPTEAMIQAGDEAMPAIVDYALKDGILYATPIYPRHPLWVSSAAPYRAMIGSILALKSKEPKP